MVSSIGSKSWRAEPFALAYSRTEGCPALLSPAYIEPWPNSRLGLGARRVLKVRAGSGWTRIEDHY